MTPKPGPSSITTFKGVTNRASTIPLREMGGIQVGKEQLVASLRKALSTTKNTSAPGPDRVSYRLLKEIMNIELGEQSLGVLADFLRGRRSLLSSTGDGREVTVVMIPKEGKDLSKVKGWRPMVLMNCLLKLMDKVVANELQKLDNLFHQGQFGSRRGKAAIDMAIQATTAAQLEKAKGRGCAWALGDIKSAFYYTRKNTVLARLRQKQPNNTHLEGLARYVHWFYQSQAAD